MPLDTTRVRALCFDVDGTLMDTDDAWVERVAVWLAPLSRLFPESNPRPFARRLVMAIETPGNALLQLLDRMDLDGHLEGFDRYAYRRGWRASPREYHIIPGARTALDLLRPHYPMAIVSTRGARGVRGFLQHFDLLSHFPVVVTGQSQRYTKPSPDPVLFAAEQMGIPAQACLMVGDTTVDVLAGKAAGAQTLAVLSGFGERHELHRAGADAIIYSVADLPALLIRP